MSNSLITLFVIIDRETIADAFPIDIDTSKTIGHLKQLIKDHNPRSVSALDARKLRLWHINIPYASERGYEDTISLHELCGTCLLAPYLKLKDFFGANPDGRKIHILVELPEGKRGNAFFGSSVRLRSLVHCNIFIFIFFFHSFRDANIPCRSFLFPSCFFSLLA